MDAKEKTKTEKRIKELADLYGKTEAQQKEVMAKIKKDLKKDYPDFDKLEDWKKELQTLGDKLLPKDVPGDYEGESYKVHINPKAASTCIKDAAAKIKIVKFLGKIKFQELWTIGIGILRDNLTKDQQEEVLETDYTGARAIKVTPLEEG